MLPPFIPFQSEIDNAKCPVTFSPSIIFEVNEDGTYDEDGEEGPDTVIQIAKLRERMNSRLAI